jgi:actin-like ATPase involved in cell morphogenesis
MFHLSSLVVSPEILVAKGGTMWFLAPEVPTIPSMELRRRCVVPPLPRNISEQEGRITEVVAISYQGILTKVQEELEQLFDVQRSTLGLHSGY